MPGTNAFDPQTKYWRRIRLQKKLQIVDTVWLEIGWQTSKSMRTFFVNSHHLSKTPKNIARTKQNQPETWKMIQFTAKFLKSDISILPYSLFVRWLTVYSQYYICCYYRSVFCLDIYISVQFTVILNEIIGGRHKNK